MVRRSGAVSSSIVAQDQHPRGRSAAALISRPSGPCATRGEGSCCSILSSDYVQRLQAAAEAEQAIAFRDSMMRNIQVAKVAAPRSAPILR